MDPVNIATSVTSSQFVIHVHMHLLKMYSHTSNQTPSLPTLMMCLLRHGFLVQRFWLMGRFSVLLEKVLALDVSSLSVKEMAYL